MDVRTVVRLRRSRTGLYAGWVWVLAVVQSAHTCLRHQAPVTMLVQHYAMSGGTLLALGPRSDRDGRTLCVDRSTRNSAHTRPRRSWEAFAQMPLAQVSDRTPMIGRPGAHNAADAGAVIAILPTD